jgi:ABC-type branched-subunit amino acid transport system substrate-binding protein
MDAYFHMINEKGGIHGRNIKFVYYDDAYEPPKTVSAVRQMVQNDGVFAFVGGVGTAPGMAVKQYIVENEIPWVAPATGSTHFAYPPTENIFAVYPLYPSEAVVQVNYALDSLDAENIAIIYQNDDYGKGGLVGAQVALEARGMELVAEVSTETMDSDLTSQAALLRESGADVVLLWLLPRQAAIIKGRTSVIDYNPTWIASSTLSDMTLMHEITEGAWEGVIFSYFGEMPYSDDEVVQNYRTAFEEKYPDARWGTFAYSGFVFAEPLVEALRGAGRDLTREALIEALESLDGWKGAGPEITYGPNQRQGTSSVYLVKCLGPEEYEILTDYMDADLEINEVIERMN